MKVLLLVVFFGFGIAVMQAWLSEDSKRRRREMGMHCRECGNADAMPLGMLNGDSEIIDSGGWARDLPLCNRCRVLIVKGIRAGVAYATLGVEKKSDLGEDIEGLTQ